MFRAFGFLLLVPTIFSFAVEEIEFTKLFGLMAVIFIAVFSTIKYFLKKEECRLKHAVISLALAWTSIALASAIPFLVHGIKFIDAFFEAFSGWTGTGFSMIQNPQNLPLSLNFWRGLIQWVGGFGIVVLVLLLYERPKTAFTLFLAEGRSENFYTDLLKVARMIVLVYALFTLLGFCLMLISGVPLFDAFINTLTSIATGGFTTNEIGVGYFGIMPMCITILLMLIGGISFASHYNLIKGKIKQFFKNPEIIFMFIIIVFAFAFVSLEIYLTKKGNYFDGLFYIVSALTGTGATTKFPVGAFPSVATLILIFLMISGPTYGSTGGAIKLWRTLVLFKVIRRQILKVFLPCLLYTSPSPRDLSTSRMPSSA